MFDINEIAKIIKRNGGNMYLVGGAVRDILLGQQPHDYDYCVTGLTQEEFINIFPQSHIRGKSFSVFDLQGYEIALARTEQKSGVGHKEFNIQTGKSITIEQDLARRDITINAIAKDVLTGKIIDPYNGKQDIENKIIRATTHAFVEDPLRVYRVARFASCLKFNVEENTLNLMNKLKEELGTLPKERVFEELKKALSSNKPSIFFETLKSANVLDVHFKEINDLIGAIQPVQFHPEGDAYCHTMQVVDKASVQTKRLEVRYAALVHDLGKGVTPKEILPHHYGHDKNGVKLVENLSNRIGVPITWKKCGKLSAQEHMRAGIFFKMKPAKQVELIEKLDRSILGIDGMQIIVNSDNTNRQKNGGNQFEKLGYNMMNEINGEYICSKYKGLKGIEIKNKLKEERIKWIKNKL